MSKTENPAADVDLVPVDDLDQFVTILVNWHQNKVQVLTHLKAIPDGSVVQVGEGKEVTLTGDFLAGFKLGLELALGELGMLPFTAEVEDVAH